MHRKKNRMKEQQGHDGVLKKKKKKNVWMLCRPAPASWSGDSALMLVVYVALMIIGSWESFNLDEFGSSAVEKKKKRIYIYI